ncbi:hypothetical protein Tco_0497481 [Tanacetum coccineum]
MARKIKKASPSKKDSDLVHVDKEPVQKGKRVKRPAKKSTTSLQRCRHQRASCGNQSVLKLTQMKEVRKKSLRDFHKTHPSGSGTVAKKPQSVDKITPTVTSEGTRDKLGVPDMTEDVFTESEFESWGNDKDDSNNEQELSNEGIDARLKEPTQTDKEIVQGEGVDAKMNNAQQGNENLETTQEQVVEDAHVTIYTITKKTEVPVTSSSRSSDLASKFLKFLDIPHADAEIVSSQTHSIITELEKEIAELKKDPLHTQVTTLVDEHLDIRLGETREEFMKFLSESLTKRIKEQVKDQLPQILPKEVSNFAPPVIENLIKESCDEVTLAKVSSQPHSTYEAASTLTEFELKKILIDKMEKSESCMAAPKHRDCYDSLKKSYDLDKYFFFSYDVYSLKHGRKDKDKDKDPFAGSDRGSSKGTKSQPKPSGKSVQSEEPVFEVADSDMPQDQERNPGDNDDEPRKEDASRRPAFRLLKGTRSNYAELEYDFEECYKALSEKLDWENPKDGDYPFDLSKPLPLIAHGKHQRIPFEYFINNDLKYLQGGVSTMTYTTSTTKTKADQYDLPSIEDMVPNIWIEDLQLGVESYQKHINVTKPDTTRPDLRKRHTYTPYKDPQGFIYVDDFKRNRLMRSDELYKFSDGTLTRLLSSLEDITKNIDMEYLPKIRWSTLEKKRAHFMIKDINKLLKERRMMRSLEKFVRGRLYGTDLRLLQRTI